jgi:hypothetical protein
MLEEEVNREFDEVTSAIEIMTAEILNSRNLFANPDLAYILAVTCKKLASEFLTNDQLLQQQITTLAVAIKEILTSRPKSAPQPHVVVGWDGNEDYGVKNPALAKEVNKFVDKKYLITDYLVKS